MLHLSGLECLGGLADTLLAYITPALNGFIFSDMALKGPPLFEKYWPTEHLKNNTNKGRH